MIAISGFCLTDQLFQSKSRPGLAFMGEPLRNAVANQLYQTTD